MLRQRPGDFSIARIAFAAGGLLAGILALLGVANTEDDLSAAGSPSAGALAERGAYLATAANCVSCHTVDGGAAYAGGLAFHTPFGVIHSTNITSDRETGIGGWTFEQFARSMRKGVGDGGEHLYPVFPYTSFAKITDEDLRALYAYFQSVPAVRSEARKNQLRFPYDQRWLLGGWKLLFLDSGAYSPDPEKSPEWNRGAYLVEALAHCAACHTPRNALGAKRAGRALSGGVYIDRVPSGDYRDWSAPNLTAASTGLRHWSERDIVDYLKMGKNQYAAAFGPMNEVVINSTRHLSDSDLNAIAAYFKDVPPFEDAVGATAPADKIGRGRTLYNLHCGTCHQPTGLGAPETGARLANSPIVQASDPSTLLNVIIYGPELPNPRPPIGKWKQMPSFNDKLKDDEIAALASFLRQEWGHQSGEVSIEAVAAQRPPFDTPFTGLGE